jgi:hypothetical protein
MEESSNLQRRYYLKTKKLLQEKVRAKKLLREKRLRDSYFASREDIYFHWLKENHLVEWKKPDGRYNEHAMLIPNMDKELYESVELFKNDADDVTGMTKLKED